VSALTELWRFVTTVTTIGHAVAQVLGMNALAACARERFVIALAVQLVRAVRAVLEFILKLIQKILLYYKQIYNSKNLNPKVFITHSTSLGKHVRSALQVNSVTGSHIC
jgi:hypothetical protein